MSFNSFFELFRWVTPRPNCYSLVPRSRSQSVIRTVHRIWLLKPQSAIGIICDNPQIIYVYPGNGKSMKNCTPRFRSRISMGQSSRNGIVSSSMLGKALSGLLIIGLRFEQSTNKGLNRPNQSSQVYLLPFGLFEVDIHKIPMFHHVSSLPYHEVPMCWEKSQFFVVSSHLLMVSLMENFPCHELINSTLSPSGHGSLPPAKLGRSSSNCPSPGRGQDKHCSPFTCRTCHPILQSLYISMLFQANRNQGLQKMKIVAICCHTRRHQNMIRIGCSHGIAIPCHPMPSHAMSPDVGDGLFHDARVRCLGTIRPRRKPPPWKPESVVLQESEQFDLPQKKWGKAKKNLHILLDSCVYPPVLKHGLPENPTLSLMIR